MEKVWNCTVASAFAYMKIIEKWGSGIPRMIRECREYGLSDPEFIDYDGDFRVNMYRKITDDLDENGSTTQTTQSTTQTGIQTTQSTTQTGVQTTQTFQADDMYVLSKKDKAILSLVHEHPELTQKELAMELGWTVDQVKYYLNKMKKWQIIKRVGSRHNGQWKFLVEESVFFLSSGTGSRGDEPPSSGKSY